MLRTVVVQLELHIVSRGGRPATQQKHHKIYQTGFNVLVIEEHEMPTEGVHQIQRAPRMSVIERDAIGGVVRQGGTEFGMNGS